MNKLTSFLISFIAIVVILIYGQNLLIPLIISILIWFLITKIKYSIDKIDFFKKKFPSWIKSLITSIFIFSLLGLISNLLSSSILSIAKAYKKYEANIELVTAKVNAMFNIDILEFLKSHAGDIDYLSLLNSVFNSLTMIFGNAFIILIYSVFLFVEESNFNIKLRAVFTDETQLLKVTNVILAIEKSIADYVGLKTLVSLITGVLSYIVLAIIGIDAPILWASLIFLLNFIPTIGSLIGTLFPAIFSLLQFGEFTPFLMILIFIGMIQLLVGNFIEPKLMGNSLNLSSLVTLFALSFWGSIWGVTGMILSIPITVILLIIFSQFKSTKSIAMMLSTKGNI